VTLSLTHKFVSTVPDGTDTSVVRPSNWNDTHDVSGTLPIANGGTNTTTVPANGQILIGNGTDYTVANLTAGTGVTITNTAGGITLSAPDNGTVTGVTATSPLASSGGTAPDISLTGTVPVANGGTGAATLTGYVIGNGTSAMTASATIPTSNLTGTLPVANGGTGQTTYTDGQLLIGNSTGNTLAKATLTAGTGVTITNGPGTITISAPDTGTVTAVTASSPLASSGGAAPDISLTGTVPIANGGTAGTATPTAGAVPYGTGTAYAFTNAGTTGQVLTSAGSGTPIWTTPTTGTVTSVTASSPLSSSGGATPDLSLTGTVPIANGGTNATATPTAGAIAYGTGTAYAFTAAGTTGQVLTSNGTGAPTWSAAASGTVTSVAQSFTGGLISVSGSPITSSGTLALTVAGTSGGVPYFSSASTWASSAALAANALMVGGGAGAAPSTVTTGTGVVTALGVNTGTAGAFVVNGGALGTPSSGTVTNLTGTASININGTVGATTANTIAATTIVGTTTSATGFAVGRQGTTNPVLNVDASTASVVTGLNLKGAAAAGGMALSVTSSGTNENLTIDAKGSGTITLGGTSTGNIVVPRSITQTLSTTGGLTNTITNSNAGTGAYSYFELNNGTATGGVALYGSGFTTSNVSRQNGTELRGSGAGGLTLNSFANQPLYFAQNNTEAARITTTKNLLVGATADTNPTSRILATAANDGQLGLNATTSGNGVYTTLTFFNQGAGKAQLYWFSTDARFYVQNGTGGVYLATNGTSWTSNSDERLKTDLQNIGNATEKVSSLRAVTGRFLTDEPEKRRAFLIAQDVQNVLPEAVDADNPDALGVAYTDVIPLLVAAIKELKVRIETLENN
jgi:hypothetical protein